MRFQRIAKDEVDAYEYTDPMSEELVDALKEREGMYCFRSGRLIIHTLFKDKRVNMGDYIVFMPDGTLDCQAKDIFFSKFEKTGE